MSTLLRKQCPAAGWYLPLLRCCIWFGGVPKVRSTAPSFQGICATCSPAQKTDGNCGHDQTRPALTRCSEGVPQLDMQRDLP
eukprot:7559713-Karenia_brevis.AAC.1